MPRLRSGLEIGGSTEIMVSACSETLPISPVKDKVDLEMAELESEFKRYSDKANTTSQLYLNLLITSYQDQIASLKEELKEKNNVIYDILYATSTAARRNHTIKTQSVPKRLSLFAAQNGYTLPLKDVLCYI